MSLFPGVGDGEEFRGTFADYARAQPCASRPPNAPRTRGDARASGDRAPDRVTGSGAWRSVHCPLVAAARFRSRGAVISARRAKGRADGFAPGDGPSLDGYRRAHAAPVGTADSHARARLDAV